MPIAPYLRVPQTDPSCLLENGEWPIFTRLRNGNCKMNSTRAGWPKSPYVPAADGSAQLALWKRIDMVQDVLSEADRAEAGSIGLIDIEEYEARVARGELV